MNSDTIALEPDEVKKLAASIDRVRKLYPMNLNPKMLAWLHLATTAGTIYGPRLLILFNSSKKAAKLPRPEPVPIRETPRTAPVQEPVKQAVNAEVSIFTPSQLDNRPPVDNEE